MSEPKPTWEHWTEEIMSERHGLWHQMANGNDPTVVDDVARIKLLCYEAFSEIVRADDLETAVNIAYATMEALYL